MKFKIILFALGLIVSNCILAQCPDNPWCNIRFESYGSDMTCDNDSTYQYDGSFGKLAVPIKVHLLGPNISTSFVQVENQFNLLNSFYNGIANMPFELSIVDTINNPSADFDFFCLPNTDCDCPDGGNDYDALIPTLLNDPNVIHVFITDTLVYPPGDSDCNGFGWGLAYEFGPIIGSNGLILMQSVIEQEFWSIIVHELGHVFGLFHTFETGAFPINGTCDDGCREGDAIEDTPFDTGPWTPGQPSPINIMDYDETLFTPLSSPDITMSPFQKIKFQKILFECRSNLCSNPIQPDIRTIDGLPSFQLTYVRGDQLDTLISVLDNITGTNSGNFALFKLKDENGLLIDSWYIDSLDLNTVFDGANHPNHGTFTIESIDSSLYNPNCKSSPTIIDIFIDPCNNDSICDSEEECTTCSDCWIKTIQNYAFNGDSTINAMIQIQLDNTTVNHPHTLTLNSPAVLIETNSEIKAGAEMIINNHNGCTVTDADGNVYKTVLIGSQLWMAENLNVGTMINNGTSQTNNGIIEKYCYDDNPNNCDIYGALYQWDEMMEYTTIESTKGICPTGWHLPSDNEIKALEIELGMTPQEANMQFYRGTDQGPKIAGNEPLWSNGALDQNAVFGLSGFDAPPAGIHGPNGYFSKSYVTYIWSSTGPGGKGWHRRISFVDLKIGRYSNGIDHAFSVRCVKNY